jgi:hypothetical protein
MGVTEYRYIGKDGKHILARELEDQRDELQDKLTKALVALDEAIYMLDPDEEDMAKKAGVYRIVTTYKELKGDYDD